MGKIFDETAVERLQKWGGTKLAREIIDIFFKNAPEYIAAAQTALEANDLKAVRFATHTLRSTAGNVGAMHVMEVAQEAEALALGGKVDGLPSTIRALEAAFVEVTPQLQQVRRELGS